MLEYASVIWSPHLVTLINKIKSVQHRLACFTLNDYSRSSSVTNMLERLNLPSLKSRRVCNPAIMMFKILNNIVDIPIDPSELAPNTLPTGGHNLIRFCQLPVRIGKSFFQTLLKFGISSHATFHVNRNDLDGFKLQLYIYTS